MTNPALFNNLELRRALSTFATGVTVISILDARGNPRGLTVNSFSSVSLDPPLILWCLACNTPDFMVFRDTGHFAVNILAEGQVAVSERFASLDHNSKFTGIDFTPGLANVPLIKGCAAALECRRETTYPGGDHMILLGRVERLHHAGLRPLLFYASRYRTVGHTL
jgi:flavin reductase (DIM6/NTAB) family NADH-FMN oxidoreductase RutF